MIRLDDAASILYCDICGEGWPAYTADLANVAAIEANHGACCFDGETESRDEGIDVGIVDIAHLFGL